jgi:choline dehydrogenase-like flavoprotein
VSRLSLLEVSPNLIDGSQITRDLELRADVCVIGSGAGGAVTAAVLAESGLDVVVVEEGGYHDAREFTMREVDVSPKLYQEALQRTTQDLGIAVLQGRAVGGSTVVNWTTSFRTPEPVLSHWAKHHAVAGFTYLDLVPHYEAIEARLGIHKVSEESMNANNRKLFDGCKRMGWNVETLRRNVVACLQTGQCGLGCPVNAKRSMLVTMIPDAVDAGARILHRARVDRLAVAAGEVHAAEVTLLDTEARLPSGKLARIVAKRFVLSGGAINGPALLLRSGLNDNGRVGVRTFLHPVIASSALYDEPIDPYAGAPQSAASHHFADRGERVGVFLEAAPTYPALAAAGLPGFGARHRDGMESLGHRATHIGICIDGFHETTPGGTGKLRPSGAPLLDYPIPEPLWEAFRFAQRRLGELQLASGARSISTLHEPPLVFSSAKELDRVDRQRWETGAVGIFTAHQMGGCAMGDDPARSVVRSEDLRHHTLKNLFVIDGSVFPTSLGVNPQESIYGLAHLMATRLAAVAKEGRG